MGWRLSLVGDRVLGVERSRVRLLGVDCLLGSRRLPCHRWWRVSWQPILAGGRGRGVERVRLLGVDYLLVSRRLPYHRRGRVSWQPVLAGGRGRGEERVRLLGVDYLLVSRCLPCYPRWRLSLRSFVAWDGHDRERPGLQLSFWI